MSRFTLARRNRILVWTGAALAWGTAVTSARLEPVRAAPELGANSTTVTADIQTSVVMPTQPRGGLVILRYTPSETITPEVQTIYVKQPAAATGKAAPKATASAPKPKSSGS